MQLKVWENDRDLTEDEEFEFLDYLGAVVGGEFAHVAYLVDQASDGSLFLAVWMTITDPGESTWLNGIGDFLKHFNPSVDYEIDWEN